MQEDDPALFEDFVAKSLGPEKEMMEEINANVVKNGGTPTAIETRMLESITRVFEESAVDPANVPDQAPGLGGEHSDAVEGAGLAASLCLRLQAELARDPRHVGGHPYDQSALCRT
jgi:hypothetical protein